VSGQLQTPWKEPLVSTVQEAEWGPESVWTLWSKEKSLAPVGNQTPVINSVARRYTDGSIYHWYVSMLLCFNIELAVYYEFREVTYLRRCMNYGGATRAFRTSKARWRTENRLLPENRWTRRKTYPITNPIRSTRLNFYSLNLPRNCFNSAISIKVELKKIYNSLTHC
jgi:hypothetical protein